MRRKEFSKQPEPRKFFRLVTLLYEDAGEIGIFDRVYDILHRRAGRRSITHRDVLLTLMSSFLEVEAPKDLALVEAAGTQEGA
jgi:hypothetical protein